MHAVEAKFIPSPQKDQSGTSDPDGQAEDVEKAVAFVVPQVAESRFKIRCKHFTLF
jgi:hypothetical protein